MYFKPRIFISSTLKDKIKLRETLFNKLESLGAEVLLYEKNLTPSIIKAVYRDDILKSDFVIFIFDEKYGTKTENGISGIEEEFRLIEKSNKPFHIYLKIKSERLSSNMKQLTEYIKKNNFSYYLFKDEEDLTSKILKTTFTISHEITLSNLLDAEIDDKIINIISTNSDIKKSLKHINRFEAVFRFDSQTTRYDFENSDLYIAVFDYIINYYNDNGYDFNDSKISQFLTDIYSIVQSINSHIALRSVSENSREVLIENLGTYNLSTLDKYDGFDYVYLQKQNQNLKKLYNEFKKYIENKIMQNQLLKLNLKD